MRWTVRSQVIVLVILAIGCFFFISGFNRDALPCEKTVCPTTTCAHNVNSVDKQEEDEFDSNLRHVGCSVDGGKKMQCVRNSNDVFFPFNSFLRKHLDVTGKFVTDAKTSEDRFDWTTSYSKVRRPPEDPYDSLGPFGHFGTYSVETRDRVRCISAVQGVPMSTQWGPDPYFYPIQIAQYALQHYSRNFTEPAARTETLGLTSNSWSISPDYGKSSKISEKFDHSIKEKVVEIDTDPKLENPGIFLQLNADPELHILQFGWLASADASFTVIVERFDTKQFVKLNYVRVDDSRCVWGDEESERTFTYALGAAQERAWTTVTRDVVVDIGRALLTTVSGGKKVAPELLFKTGDVRLVSLAFRGQVTVVQRVSQRNSAHMEQFLTAADWFLANQDELGGWPVPVERSIAEKRLVLEAGWHSAMAQGHAMSVLTRAYAVTNDTRYLAAANKATKLFDMDARDGGVRNVLLGVPWYEEYPTTPGSFVLNGFMYALIGLYDLSRAVTQQSDADAHRLFKQGMDSLKKLLPFYDTGSGSAYDLRHVTLRVAPNLARWDYHTVHVYQLLWLFNIDKDEFLKETAERWASYTLGRRAKHN